MIMNEAQIKQLAEMVLTTLVDEPYKRHDYQYFYPIGVLVFTTNDDYGCNRVVFVNDVETKEYKVNLKSKYRGGHINFCLAVVFGCEDTELWYIRPFMWHKGFTYTGDYEIHPSEFVEITPTAA